ncbi:MAG: hypothetical protein EOM20_16310 [Spartobacteria bacterium]|nr:hypothetical protein [Spartobacteria bacterium]
MKKRHAQYIMAALLLGLVTVNQTVHAQGSLDPAAAPTPTMKTLDQVEPRTAITNVPITISAPGSYYLTGNLSGGGISITTNDVTLDLMGFTLSGSGNGIAIGGAFATPLHNIVVRNGGIREFSTGIAITSLKDGLFEQLRLQGVLKGIAISSKAEGCVFQQLIVDDCQTGVDAQTFGECTFKGNTIRDSVISHASTCGIRLDDQGASGNVYHNNIIENVKIDQSYSAIEILTSNYGSMRGNVIRSCTTYSAYGISSSGANGTLVEKNMFVKIPDIISTVAVQFADYTTNNLVIANVSIGHDNGYVFNVPDHNTWGPIVTNKGALPSTGDAAHPWANFMY